MAAVFYVLVASAVLMTSYACPVRECSCNASPRGITIDCRRKNFDKVPEFTVTGNEVYYELKLSDNQIAVLPGKAFKKLNVAKIDLSGNQIRKISDAAFEGLETSLKELVVEARSDTPIKFPSTLLHSLSALESIKIKGFDMPILEHGLFLHSKNLQRLTVENCKIITIFENALHGLEDKLTLLDLSNNKLTSVPIVELQPLVHLKKLVLAQNRITVLQANSFQNMSQLVDLDLSMNSIQKIESAAFHGLEQNLEYLGLHANMISQNSLLAIANLINIEQLNLAYNLLSSTLPDYTFRNLKKLAYLNLQGNRLTAISPATFEGLGKSLNVLLLSENRLTTLPDEGFRHLENLKWLYLDLMNLGGSFTQHTFHGLENTLEYLTMEGAQFMTDDLKAVHYLKALKTLNLCENHVRGIPEGTFTTLIHLEQLLLCQNNIENITQASLRGVEESLQVLNLESNAIEVIDQCALKDFKKLRELNLDANPLNCDCRMQWLREWVEQQGDVTKMLMGWKCARPIQNRDRLFKHVPVQELTCSELVETKCDEFVKPTASADVPHAHIKAATVDGDSVSLKWNIDNKDSVLGVRLFYKMTENETYSYTLLLNPLLREYIIHDLFKLTNYTICIGLDLKLGQRMPDEECITVQTEKEAAGPIVNEVEDKMPLYMIVGGGVGGLVFVVLVIVIAFAVCKWRRKTRQAHGIYDTPWVSSRPKAPSLSTLPCRRSDFENPMRHYYSRPLSCGTMHTVSSHLPRSSSMATVLDGEYDRCRVHVANPERRDEYKRAQSMDLNAYDMDRCLYKIDKMMASATNLLEHQRPGGGTVIPPPYQGECLYSAGVRAGYHPDLPAYPDPRLPPGQQQRYSDQRYSDQYPVFAERGPRESYRNSSDSERGHYPTRQVCPSDTSHTSAASMRDSGHMSGFPSYTSGFDELEPPPGEYDRTRNDHIEEAVEAQSPRSQQDPLPPPPAYLLGEREPDAERIYDEIYTIY